MRRLSSMSSRRWLRLSTKQPFRLISVTLPESRKALGDWISSAFAKNLYLGNARLDVNAVVELLFDLELITELRYSSATACVRWLGMSTLRSTRADCEVTAAAV